MAVVRGETASLVEERDRRRLAARAGEWKLRELERRARLDRIDDAWAEYLLWVTSYAQSRWLAEGGLDPVGAFHTEAERTFQALLRGADEEVLAFFDNDDIPEETPASFDRAAVWTCQLPEQPWTRSRDRVIEAVRKRLGALGVLEA
jgi:hypothetical protein